MGGKAGRIFLAEKLDFVTVEPVLADVEKYLPVLADKKGLDLPAMRAVLALLPITVVSPGGYASHTAEARELVGGRDPDDVPLLALALALRCPIWSNDHDLRGIPGVTVYTTAELLAMLEDGGWGRPVPR